MSAQPIQPATIRKAAQAGPEADRFLVLDGLRGIAAFAVILDHVPSGILGELVPNRALSVDFFFVLSGFVLAHAYGAKLGSRLSPWSFMRARLIRLYPFYILGTIIGVLGLLAPNLLGSGPWLGWANVLMIVIPTLFFLPVPPGVLGGDALYPCNGPAWSLFFELVANLVFAVVARFLTWRVLAVALSLGAILLTFSLAGHPGVRGPGWLWSHFDAGLARVLFGFFAGVAIYRLRKFMAFPTLPWWAVVAAFIAIIAVPVSLSAAPFYDAFAAVVLFPALVAFAAVAKAAKSIAKVFAALGLLSYGIYAIHVPVLGLLSVVLGAYGMSLPDTELTAIFVAGISALFAALAYKLYDVPIRAWLSRVFPRGAKAEKPHVSAGEHG